MASSAFYPIIYACFLHGYVRMDREAAALRYALTVVVYLTAVTIYAVRRVFAVQRTSKRMIFADTSRQDTNARGVETGTL
jgi:hypothetical protein